MLIGTLSKRAARSAGVLFGVALTVFFLLKVAPGDPVTLLLGQGATEDAVRVLRQDLGLNQPLPIQALRFAARALQGDFGVSLVYQKPVLDLVLGALPYTVALALAAFALTVVIAVPAGVVAAYKKDTATDHLVRGAILLFQALPSFWVGIMLIFVFAVQLRWLPTSGSGGLKYLVLPAITLCTYQLALLTRIVRSGMLDVLSQDYIRTAYAKGLSTFTVLRRHALRNTMLPIITILALQLGAMLSGAVITEAVFAWPGIGSLAMSAMLARDYPLVLGVVILASACIVVLNLAADTLNVFVDPRTRD